MLSDVVQMLFLRMLLFLNLQYLSVHWCFT